MSPQARVREGCTHRITAPDYDPEANPTGKPGPKAQAGDIIEVTEAELAAYHDKLERVAPVAPVAVPEEGENAEPEEEEEEEEPEPEAAG